jgi:hypothetical protein
MPDRRRQIELLIATRFDHLWFPSGTLRTSSGLAPAKRVPCPACATGDRPGFVAEKRGGVVVKWTPCTTCGGRNPTDNARAKRGRGFIAVDPMDSDRRAVGSADTHATSRPRKRVKCDACQDRDGKPTGVLHGDRCPHCDGDGWRDLHRFDLHLDVRDTTDVDALCAAIDRRDDIGSYHQLDLAIAGIGKHVNKQLRHAAVTVYAADARRLLDEVYLHAERDLDQLTVWEHDLLVLTLDYLDTRMPDPIKVPPGVAANARARRDQLKVARGRGADPHALRQRDEQIRRWAREGKPYPWICQQAQLSDRRVREIINATRSAAA